MVYVCVRDVLHTCVWGVCVFCHADVVCLCRVCILWP